MVTTTTTTPLETAAASAAARTKAAVVTTPVVRTVHAAAAADPRSAEAPRRARPLAFSSPTTASSSPKQPGDTPRFAAPARARVRRVEEGEESVGLVVVVVE